MTYGQVLAGIHASNQEEARLLQAMIHRELRERAGTPAEAVLAKWSNHLASIRRDAERKEWVGWE